MPTIHITIDDHAEALGVVAYMLNQGHQVSIDLDFVADSDDVMTRAEADIRGRLWSDHRPGRNGASPIERVSAREYDEMRRVEREMREVEREIRNKMFEELEMERLGMNRKQYDKYRADKQRAKDKQRHEVDNIMRVTSCPSCGSDTGVYCTAAAGSVYHHFVHADRRKAFNTLNEAVRAE